MRVTPLILAAVLGLSGSAWAVGESEYFQGLSALHRGDCNAAIDHFNKSIENKSIELKPSDYVLAYIGRGEAYHCIGSNDQAIADFTKAIELDPKNFWPYEDRGGAYMGKSLFDQAIADYTKAIELAPDDDRAYLFRGAGYYNKALYDQAIADFTKVTALKPGDMTAYFARAQTYAAKGLYDQVIADYTKAIEIRPDYGTYNSRAWAYHLAGRDAEGLPDADKALALAPDEGNAYDTRGNIYEKLGQKDKAVADYRKALSIKPDLKESQEGLQRLGAALAADVKYLYVSNETAGTVTVFQDGKQQCTIAPGNYCSPAPGIPAGASSTLRFVFSDGSERTIVWSEGSGLHFCLEEGLRITDCRGTDIS